MTQPAFDAATLAQVRAAHPGRSTWLTANAGSGKTRVLTDRVARLLLNGADPARILCLTYTKAAAAEMQNRLLRRLGEWAMLPAADLTQALLALGEEAPDDAALARARRLFARAIETPGGLKIQTIHAFCAGLLRRFPLEAGVPHQFTEMDDRTARLLAADILEDMASGDDRAVLDDLATIFGGDAIDGLTGAIIRHAAVLSADPAPDDLRAALDLLPGYDAARLTAEVFLGAEADLFAALIPVLAAAGGNDRKLSDLLSGLPMPLGLTALPALEGALLYGAKAKAGPFTAKIGAVPTKASQKALPPAVLDRLNDLMARVEAARPRRLGLLTAERSLILHRFARAFLARYRAAKMARGWLDFDDLITHAGRLLTDPSVADWVLFRLDGGIDHVLVDEAQDTSPGQWQVIDRLTGEFTAGEGARRRPPTLFVVGDRKQSIYSFQGADLTEFDRRRAAFLEAFAAAGQPMQDLTLAHSFRSSPAILTAVDATFAEAAAGLGGAPHHIAFHGDHPGRVDLWPAIVGDDAEKIRDYDDPVDLKAPDRPAIELARLIAARIRAMIDNREQVPGRGPADPPRPITEGDVLILVQRRSDLFGAIIAECKAAGLAVAGADRLKLAAEIAVRDIRAALSVLATPDDDLALAEVLRSPLIGWTEAELFALAQPRPATLWEALRNAGDSPALALLNDLRDRADFLRPHEVIDRLLTRHRGRERLLARLGPEAEDGIDVLLAQALAYERAEVPSLTGFLVWLDADDVQVKRQMEGAGHAIRVMTVHGAKGLEAPIVIMPDTAKPKTERAPPQLMPVSDGGPLLWRAAQPDRPPAMTTLAEDASLAEHHERARLLYVAMTRAESWLIVAAAGDAAAPSWHADVAAGLARCGAASCADPAGDDLPGPVLRLAHGDWPQTLGAAALGPSGGVVVPAPAPADPLPHWALTPAPPPVPGPQPVTATGLGGAKAMVRAETDAPGASDLPGPGAELIRAQAMQAGDRLHRLLDLLPGAADPASLAAALEATPEELARAQAILARADLDLPGAEVLTEVDIAAPPPWPGAGPLIGSIDRLSITADRLRIVDYKSNAAVPATADDIPDGLLRQLGAYHAAVTQIYPGRAVELAILWTATGLLMPVPADLAARAFAAAAPGRLA
ncbi:double-strand break repair helicase AddA [Paracoccus sp. p3-h83]|uniref:double-strand break repair helicase AddA n=1 Tax=Paracoccus sp. p3-h83 TaxID=3342805 RepID=UPI0035B6D4B3